LWPWDRPLPSRATVNRVFGARGLLVKVPQRRPRRRSRRFQRDQANELWQFDGFDYHLAEGPMATVLHLSDDCSRVDLALQAVVSENGADVWDTFCLAVARYGLPVAGACQMVCVRGSSLEMRNGYDTEAGQWHRCGPVGHHR
ncbi:MAG: hypothetical protein M3537_02295, partial [Chloroflexota bacterium]|nr:hypothetical protein [Chloroflexota bacterium]